MSDTTKTQEDISDALDAALLRGIKDGVAVQTEEGMVIAPAPAAFLNVARQRLKDLGISKLAAPGSDLAALAKECGFKTLELPPLDDERDDAATSERSIASA